MEESIVQHQQRWLQEGDDKTQTPLQLFSVITTNVLLFFLIFGLSATVEVKNMRKQITNKKAIATGVAMQFLIMPFLGFVAIMMLKNTAFTEAMGITLLVVTASPGGSYSNWWCSLFNAELALSVAMTSVSSILSVALLPANMLFYSWLAYTVVLAPEEGHEEVDILVALDFGAIFITLGVVMGAILTGLYAGYKYDNAQFHTRANKFGSICGLSLILFSAFLGSGVGEAETNFWSLHWSFYVGVAFPCVVGMTLANIIARSLGLTRPETVAISIECCYQNTAIATSVAVTMFSDPDTVAQAVSVPLFYGLVEAIIIFVYCLWAWKVGWTKAPANEKICVVITHTYEVDEDPQHEFDEPINPEELTWWGRMFVPREKMANDGGSEAVKKKEVQCECDTEPRGRMYSADVTVATTAPTPRTPETSLEPIPQEVERDLGQFSTDLEAPSTRGGGGSGGKFVSSSITAVPEISESCEETSEFISEQAPPQQESSSLPRDQGAAAADGENVTTIAVGATPEEMQEEGMSAYLPDLPDPPKLESSASTPPEGVVPDPPQHSESPAAFAASIGSGKIREDGVATDAAANEDTNPEDAKSGKDVETVLCGDCLGDAEA